MRRGPNGTRAARHRSPRIRQEDWFRPCRVHPYLQSVRRSPVAHSESSGVSPVPPAYTVIATWPHGLTAVRAAAPLLAAGGPALDAAIAGAQAVEDDPSVNSVGYGGLGDAA